MSQAKYAFTLESFSPAPGQILLDKTAIKEEGVFVDNSVDKEVDSPCYKAKVLKVGSDVFTDAGVPIFAPCKVGDIVLYCHKYGTPELEISFTKYPIVSFNNIVGVFK